MITVEILKEKIQGLIDKANAKTKFNDATLTASVNSLIAGYGVGSGATPTDDRTTMSHWYGNLIGKQRATFTWNDDTGEGIYERTPPLESVTFPRGTQDMEDFSDFTTGVFNDDGSPVKTGVWTKTYRGTLDASKATTMADAFYDNEYLEKINGEIIFGENLIDVSYMFYGCHALTEAPYIPTNKVKRFEAMFASCSNLQTIPSIDFSSAESFPSATYNAPFAYCTNLVNLTVNGTISKTGLSFQWSKKLSKASLTSIVNALSDNTENLSITLPEDAINSAFVSKESMEWINLKDTKPNWEFKYA